MRQNTIYFENEAQQAIWIEELAGQISDGAWENSSPNGHWKCWCDAKVAINKENAGNTVRSNSGGRTRRNYNFVGELCVIQCILDRMIVQGRLANRYKDPEIVSLYMELFDDMHDGCPFAGLPIDKGKFWDERRKKLFGLKPFFNEIKAVALDESLYDIKLLKKDLRAINRILKKIL